MVGLNKLPSNIGQYDLAVSPTFKGSVKLTVDPEPFCLHIDRSAAIATLLLKGLFGPQEEGTFEDKLAAQTEVVRKDRAERHGVGVFLIFEGSGAVASPDFRSRRDLDEIVICLDAISKTKFCDQFAPALRGALAAIVLALPDNADQRIQKVGDVSYLIEPDKGRPVYSFSFTGRAVGLSISSTISQEAIEYAGQSAVAFLDDDTLAKVANLWVSSLNSDGADLRAFIAAWAALEIFINGMFKSTYDKKWLQVLQIGAPKSTEPYFKRLNEIMSDRHRLTDKFLIIASILNADGADQDLGQFKTLKSLRDGLHTQDIGAMRLPVSEVQTLLRKYIKLHLAAGAALGT